ncbi:MAG TPA: UDP-N-acetylmuramoyl-L-alanyl-D-glutamate--2,6-diaminopimelate ligase [Vicinamibacterales bacterium]
MTLGELFGEFLQQADRGTLTNDRHAGVTVTGVTCDSRQVAPGFVFVALRGQHADGATFARDAIARGAVAVVSESPVQQGPPAERGGGYAWMQVRDGREALAHLASIYYRHPSRELTLVGITGTNGKTTTSYLLASIFEAAGITCGRIGTVGYRIGNREFDAARTTPESPDLQRMLRDMVSQGCGACVMEVSSHALSLRRADHLHFAAGVFTNLTRDHLDFHRDMEEYFRAKRRLFERLPPDSIGVSNLDDRRGAEFAAVPARSMTYAIDAAADVQPGPLTFSLDGLRFDVRSPRGTLKIESRLVGRPNAYNILAAVASALALDVPADAIERGIAQLTDVPGRFQVVSDPADDVRVVVDYAHTDDALKNLLETARPLAAGRVITVFGCGGDRDRTKRPLMGAVAARLSDLVVVTSDNPRSEDPQQIIEEIKRGIVMPADRAPKGAQGPRSTPYLAIVDRKLAIETAVRDARPGDLVLVAGKGHERYQVIGDRTLPFDDVEVARAALNRRRVAPRAS